jgi:hypothetical protein
MNIEKLKQIEKNPDLKLKYLSLGTWGSNNVMYIPAILIVAAVAWMAMYLYFLVTSMSLNFTLINIGVSLAVIIASYLWFRSIKKKILTKNREHIDEFPVCLAKIVMGNEEERLYYCIYTTGEKRFDTSWLDNIAYKIWHADEEPNVQLRNKIDSIFKPTTLATSAKDSTLLPVEFTEGEKVFKKIYSFQPDAMASIQANDRFFPVICFNKISVPVIRKEDYSD